MIAPARLVVAPVRLRRYALPSWRAWWEALHPLREAVGSPRDISLILGTWLLTRLIIVAVFFYVAPHAPATALAPTTLTGFQRLTFFDGAWYASVAQNGYSYVPDGKQYSIAFFPLYAMVTWLVTQFGLQPAVAGILINNVAFVAMLLVVFRWVSDRCDVATARWTIGVLCCAPLSLFGSTAYSEGLFMLFAALTLRALDRARLGDASAFALLASLARFQGIALFPAFVVAIVMRRGLHARWFAALAPLGGVLAFGAYCAWRFHDPLAFVHAQSAWRTHLGFDWKSWQALFGAGIATAPALHIFAGSGALAVWIGRKRLSFAAKTAFLFAIVEAERWAWNGSEYVMLYTVVAALIVVAFRKRLGWTATTFVLAGVGIIAFVGAPYSVDRLGYAFVPTTIAFALLMRRFPSLGFATLAVMAIDLFDFALRFSRGIFVA
jgi:uncharacterized membrane protein YgdD (TMEM256/DUF423 family)